jgi:hypothetical protein
MATRCACRAKAWRNRAPNKAGRARSDTQAALRAACGRLNRQQTRRDIRFACLAPVTVSGLLGEVWFRQVSGIYSWHPGPTQRAQCPVPAAGPAQLQAVTQCKINGGLHDNIKTV